MQRNWEKTESMPPKELFPLDFVLILFLGQIKGEIDSDFKIAFEIWLEILVANWEIGVYSCELLNLDKDPCAFNIDKKYFSGQGGIYPKDDPDPKFIDLCVKIEGSATVPYWKRKYSVHYEHCFYRVPRDVEGTPTANHGTAELGQ